MITSSSNAQVKRVLQLNKKAKERKKEQIFVVEGLKMFSEAPPECVDSIYVTPQFEAGHKNLLIGKQYEVVKEDIFAQMSDTKTPQGILCLVRMPVYTMNDILRGERPLCMLLEDLQDPGNVGTIFRTGEGAGVTGILLSRNTVDIFNPKTIRSTMGSIYRMPFLYVDQMEDVLPELSRRGIHTFAAHLRGTRMYDEEDYSKGTAFFIGNEGNGLTESLAEKADGLIRIPMEGQVESLNAAVASSILMYEVLRQRRAIVRKN